MKNHKLSIILVMGLWGYGVMGLTGCAEREIRNINSEGKNIICFGDSITAGYGVEGGEDYPSLLAGMLKTPVINSGLHGDTSITALERIGSDVLSREPLLVIIEFGGNDFLKKVSIRETVKNIETMIEKIQAKGAMVAVCDIHLGLIMRSYRKEFRRLANKYQAIFIDSLLDGIINNPQLKSDFFHPNKEGNRLIAQRVYRSIISYLNRDIIRR